MRLAIIPGILLFLSSCSHETMTPQELMHFVQSEESGMRRVLVLGESRMEVQYYPGKFWEAKSQLDGKPYKGVQDSFAIFKVYFSNGDKTEALSRYSSASKEDYVQRLQYLDSDARYDFLFKQAADTNLSILYHYERTYDLVPFDCVNLSFPYSKEKTNRIGFEFHDQLLGLGIQKTHFEKEDIERIQNIEILTP